MYAQLRVGGARQKHSQGISYHEQHSEGNE
jgi:hypothetical protein